MRRFAYVCADPGIPVPGTKGASIHVESVCRALVRRGLTGTVHAARAGGPSLCGLRLHPMGAGTHGSGSAYRETDLFLENFGGALADVGRCDFIYERYSLWHVGGLARARQSGVPFVLEVNSPLVLEAAQYRRLGQRELASGVARLLLAEADVVICVSDVVANWVVRYRGRDEGVCVIPNGVDPERFSPAEGSGSQAPAGDGPVIAFAGSFRPWHGLDDLLDAFRLVLSGGVPDANLLCIGDGPLRESFERRIRAAGLSDRVRLTGAVSQAEVANHLRSADVAVAPYPAIEPFYFSPLKIFEFMAMELPVVASDAGQIPEWVAHGERGLLYRAGRPKELARAITRLLTDRETAREYGRAGRTWVLEHATWARRVDEILTRVATSAEAEAPPVEAAR